MNDPKEGDKKVVDCYCGGELRFEFCRHKSTATGLKYFHYKKPRWILLNCYPKKAKDE